MSGLKQCHIDLLEELKEALPFSYIVAGGWVRDIFSGDDPSDIDIFMTKKDFDSAMEYIRKNDIPYQYLTPSEKVSDHQLDETASSTTIFGSLATCVEQASDYSEHGTAVHLEMSLSIRVNCNSCNGKGVHELLTSVRVCDKCNGNRYEHGKECPIQLIGVDDPVLHIKNSFDAHCNMMYIDINVPNKIIFASTSAKQDATDRIWRLNMNSSAPMKSLLKRAEKFKSRGYALCISPATLAVI